MFHDHVLLLMDSSMGSRQILGFWTFRTFNLYTDCLSVFMDDKGELKTKISYVYQLWEPHATWLHVVECISGNLPAGFLVDLFYSLMLGHFHNSVITRSSNTLIVAFRLLTPGARSSLAASKYSEFSSGEEKDPCRW